MKRVEEGRKEGVIHCPTPTLSSSAWKEGLPTCGEKKGLGPGLTLKTQYQAGHPEIQC
jgi:hypothetical protein